MHRITSAHFSLWIAVGDNVRCNWLRSELRAMAVYSTWNPRYIRRSPGWTPRGNNYGPRYARSRTSRRKANAEARAARQQRDSTTVTLNRIASFPVEIPIGTGSAGISIAHWNELRLSTYFENYAPMYDQMKLDKIKVKVVGSQAAAIQTSSISPAVVMAFDRNGLNAGQNLNPAAISTYSSSQMKNWSLGNAFTMYQTIYPSTIMEKGQYIPTDSLTDPSDDDSGTNPCTPISDPTLPFKPITLIGISTGANQTAVQTYVFTMEFEYTVTFRGMRKPSLSYLVPLTYVAISDNFADFSDYQAVVFSASPGTVTIPGGRMLVAVEDYSAGGYYRVRMFRNTTQLPFEFTFGQQPSWYWLYNRYTSYVHLLDSKGQRILTLTDPSGQDTMASEVYIGSSIFTVPEPSE